MLWELTDLREVHEFSEQLSSKLLYCREISRDGTQLNPSNKGLQYLNGNMYFDISNLSWVRSHSYQKIVSQAISLVKKKNLMMMSLLIHNSLNVLGIKAPPFFLIN